MKPTLILAALEIAYPTRRPVMLWGAPGVGKSDLVRTAADKRGIGYIDKRVAQMDPTDLLGVPFPEGGRTTWLRPDWLPTEGAGILHLDEITTAGPAMQAAVYQLTLDRALGEYRLPDGWHVVLSGNRTKDKAVSYKMSSALANRLIHLTTEVELDDWNTWAVDAGIATEVIAYSRFRPDHLHNQDATDQETGAFPSPRTWEYVSDLLGQGMPAELEFPMIAGVIGEGIASEFTAFLRVYRTLPSIDLVLMNPETAPIPDETSAQVAMCAALAARAEMENVDNVGIYLNRMPAEFGAFAWKTMGQRDPVLTNSPEFVKWSVKHGSAT